MCGIVGVRESPARSDPARLEHAVGTMCTAITHRGPDADGVWLDPEAGIALGQRRLAVVDLSPTGAQPMVSASGRSVIVYNGECYSLDGLRRDVERLGPPLRGTSDTEVVLEACERLGIDAALPRLVGMFAFALLDRDSGRLHLVRDRLGIKPLYVTRDDGSGHLRFASETRALRAVPDGPHQVNAVALAELLRTGHLASGRSIHDGVEQVPPGGLLTIDRDGRRHQRRWWDLDAVVEEGAVSRRERMPAAEVAATLDRMDALLGEAVRARMVADVPLGAFLSGGIDSSLVVALMQEASDERVRTFSIGSSSPSYDESGFARAVAHHLGTDHTELVLTDAEVVDMVPAVLADLDEPLGDPSFVPTWLVARLAREQVTVALSGDGGDEVFGGYTRHRVAAGRAAALLRAPRALKAPLAAMLAAVPPAGWDAAARFLPPRIRPGRPGEQAQKAARVLGARDARELYRRLTAVWEDGPLAVPDDAARRSLPGGSRDAAAWGPGRALSDAERMMLADTVGYLPGDVLLKVDRASMAHSLEVRVPLLDHRVVEAAWRLPIDLRIREGRTKWVLRELLARRVPRTLTDRPKRGFAQPVGAWLRGPLRPWAEDLLSVDALAATGLLRPDPVRALWDAHASGRHDHHAALWTVLVLQSWAVREGVRGIRTP